MILQAIERALIVGCNISLAQAIGSQRFGQLTTACTNLEDRYPPNTDEGVALRAGHLVMGRLLNTSPEMQAVQQAKTHPVATPGTVDLRILVQYLGEALVVAAQKCLPQTVVDLAAQWKGASAEQQIDIARQLFFMFRSESQEARGALTVDSVYTKMYKKLHEVDDDQNILPGLYGMWDKDKSPANCQGKTQMLTAFARLAGTRVLCVSPLTEACTELRRAQQVMVEEAVADLRRRGLEKADASMVESIKANQLECQTRVRDSFHVCVALELSDGRWILVDAHALSWGVFSDIWDVGGTCRMLEKYGMVLPGLQLTRHDHGQSQQTLQHRLEEARELIVRSRKMEIAVRAGPKNVVALIELVAASDDLDLLLQYHMEDAGEGMQDLSDPRIRQYAAALLVVGDPDKLLDDMWAMLDPDFSEEKIQKWLTWYHVGAINHIGNQLTDGGKLLHSVCEFGLAEHHIAMAAINSLTCGRGYRPSEQDRFFLEHSFDQTSLHNALSSDSDLRQVAAETLRALPFLHSLCAWKLRHRF